MATACRASSSSTPGSGELYRVDPATGESALIDSGDVELTAGDGLELDGSTLYVVRNRLNQIVSLELDEAPRVRRPWWERSPLRTSMCPPPWRMLGDDLWAVNARFGTDATAETEYWMTRVDAPVGMDE